MATYYIPSAAGWQANGGGEYASYLRIRVDTAYNQLTNQTTATASLEAYNSTFGIEWNVLAGGIIVGNGTTLYTFETPTAAKTHKYTSGADTVFRQITSLSNPNTWSFVVQHSEDGSAAVTVGVNLRLYNSGRNLYSHFLNLSGTIYLNEPRASDVSASGGYFGDTISITVTRKSTAFTHNVVVSCLGQSTTLATGSTAANFSWTPAVATYAPLLTNGMSTTATITVYTYNGTTLIGTKSVTVTMALKAADVAPSLVLTIEDDTTSPKDNTKKCLEYYGAFVATKSKFKITTNPTLAYSATVATTSITANGATYNSSPAVTDPIVSSAMNTIAASIVDSRQQTANASQSVSVLAYEQPKINSMAIHRCLQNGTLDDGGAYCRIDFDVEITALNNHNSKSLKAGIKRRDVSTYTETTVALNAYAVTSSVIVAADTEHSLDVRLVLADDFGSTIVVMQLSSAYVRPLNFMAGGLGIGIGKVAETQKAVDLASDWDILKNGVSLVSYIINLVYPIGSYYWSDEATDPGTLFGGTWVQVKDVFLLAAGTTYSAGSTGGEANHTLTTDEMPSHSHAQALRYTTGTDANVYAFNALGNSSPAVAGAGSTTLSGGGQAHNNMPPYLTVYVWKRTA